MATSAELLPDPTPDNPPRRRRWIPLSLKIVIAIFILCAFIATPEGVRSWQQLMAIREIERLGGRVAMHKKGPLWLRGLVGDSGMSIWDDVVGVDLSNTNATESELRHFGGLHKLSSLWLRNTPVTDAGISQLSGLTALQSLTLSGTQVSDAGLAHLSGLHWLQKLDLSETKVTGAGLVHLNGLPCLVDLHLSGTRVTDAGLENLKGLTNLDALFIDNTLVTDAGIRHLLGLTNLELLWLFDTSVSNAAMRELERELPRLHIAGFERKSIPSVMQRSSAHQVP